MNKKPLGRKSYGSIPHLPKSRLGKGDHSCSEGQARIATEKRRDKNTTIIVQEKLDGSNVGVCKIDGRIIPLNRAGYVAETSPYLQHKLFHKWVMRPQNQSRFDKVLNEGERLCGEWLIQAVGTKYNLSHEPFVVFDMFKADNERYTYFDMCTALVKGKFITPNTIHIGEPLSIKEALSKLEQSGHGALESVEGAVWRIERKGKVEYLCKFVKHDKEDGKYFPENNNGLFLWNDFPNKKWFTSQR